MTSKKSVLKKSVVKKVKAKVPGKKSAKSLVKPMVKAALNQVEKKLKKEQKIKVVRDSFTMPRNEYQKIEEIKSICLKSKMHVKKSEVLRAGLLVLSGLGTTQMKQVLSGLEKIKTGRPRKH